MVQKNNLEVNDEAPPPSYQSAMNLLQRPTTITQQPVETRLDYSPPVGRNSLTLTCPACSHYIETKLTHQPNLTTHLAALILCLMGCYCCWCVPYCTDCYKDTVHKCPECGFYIGTQN